MSNKRTHVPRPLVRVPQFWMRDFEDHPGSENRSAALLYSGKINDPLSRNDLITHHDQTREEQSVLSISSKTTSVIMNP
jgi:hypothetical protein